MQDSQGHAWHTCEALVAHRAIDIGRVQDGNIDTTLALHGRPPAPLEALHRLYVLRLQVDPVKVACAVRVVVVELCERVADASVALCGRAQRLAALPIPMQYV